MSDDVTRVTCPHCGREGLKGDAGLRSHLPHCPDAPSEDDVTPDIVFTDDQVDLLQLTVQTAQERIQPLQQRIAQERQRVQTTLETVLSRHGVDAEEGTYEVVTEGGFPVGAVRVEEGEEDE